ncbi:hypothetical protein FE374_06010 [Georgenia yuyongxinii]|uniref:Uncharacterized protein n=1 Tax=Georgenia yuyongxinii TaxID=2589797 RepID=A0A5B8C284_9MICO|nr:hypothetical protein [Georgenia yuyongxinii]QDC24237.1 hypothetical protein FE374_06010 [Georgenia yuyongxinii]
MPGVVPVELVLGRSAQAVVVLTEMRAYPTGVGLAVGVRLHRDAPRGARNSPDRPGSPDSPDTLLDMDGPETGVDVDGPTGPAAAAEWRAARLVWEMELADGRRVTSAGPDPYRQLIEHGRGSVDWAPDHPVLARRSGVSHADRAERDYWLWPLPPPGPLRVVCRWPARDIETTVGDLDADVIRDAAARARPLWPDPGVGERS